MKIDVKRVTKLPKCTIGELSVDGKFVCYTLEDTEREIAGQSVDKWKIPHDTAIPKGTYRVIVSMSNRFKKMLPEILNVAGYEGVRIHVGNTEEDTDGCILCGLVKLPASVGQSVAAMALLQPMIEGAIAKGDKVFITIS